MPPTAARAARRVVHAVPFVVAACKRQEVAAPRSRIRLSVHLAGILHHLDLTTPLAAGELARRLRVTAGTASLQVARLIALRLVVRAQDPDDARRALLRLTPAGARLRDQRTLLDPRAVEALLLTLSASERERAVLGIESLGRAAQRYAAASSPRRASE